MELTIVQVGDYFINLNNLLWAQIRRHGADPNKTLLLLAFSEDVSGSGQITIEGTQADRLIDFLKSNSTFI
jgi:hypothetical protein